MAKGIAQYGELARYYDVLYAWKDYSGESRALLRLIGRYKSASGRALLDVGCGTGQHIKHLRSEFDCMGLDSSTEMLRQARKNVPEIEFVRGDMETFDLRRRFDVILCLFSAIGYVRTYQKLARTLRNLARHLRPGGVVIIEPWLTKATADDGHISVLTQRWDDLLVTRVDHARVEGNVSVLDERIIIAERKKGLRVYRDHMVLGLFEKGEFLRLMRGAGFQSKYLKTSLAPGRGLYVGIKDELL